ncbi:MAG: helix-turn-helix domain-containing protein [Candidatus Marinimicrobia bacterium]|jgi:excisionase family DNA binding protein|nr:helix-turn-helix domain-containing protein [Candidatus Neomarinimicrobiota bacterium]MBT3825774.1 helix-turn-helix domain-containing protein [Candidatus Neomarinimicrobiota bacterium]MBT4033667.1 helix-turn-helix domain-containing protein [Candidatus Neomarinimicrobiota bacterium]MBT4362038.1 helix-turn-helix domain-containing protein [Candidatus Neomarinimicrobiota bacterium]MBT4421481.1 helix-turn-helix domain-containing protein [Candidatus Neomarinimicrobiota bacterium]
MQGQYSVDELLLKMSPEVLELFQSILQRILQQNRPMTWYTLKEAGEYLRCGVTSVRGLIKEGKLKSYRLDQMKEKSTILLHRKDLDSLVLFGRCKGLMPRERQRLNTMQT